MGSLVGKESSCNSRGPSSIPGLGSSPGKGTGYPHQHSWASLVAQMVKNPPAMWETWVWLLGSEDPLEKGTITHSRPLSWPGAFHGLGNLGGYSPWDCKESGTTEWLKLFFFPFNYTLNSWLFIDPESIKHLLKHLTLKFICF